MLLYIVIMLPGILLTLWASFSVKNRFNKYFKVPAKSAYTGFQAAREILDRNGLKSVMIEESRGMTADYYDPSTRVLKLSNNVMNLPSIASIGIAAHEAGHAIQHAKKYSPLVIRQILVPITQVSAWSFNILIFIGLIFAGAFKFFGIMKIAIIFLLITVIFSIITLPVEFNASKRAKKMLESYGIITSKEKSGISEVLNAAAMTYVGAAASSILTLIYFVIGTRSND
ncbi:MAG: zinc metallopeptidase [Spirochaetota bacterium]|nr:zinc metallopeptidase [Spirochaetota bacterium]